MATINTSKLSAEVQAKYTVSNNTFTQAVKEAPKDPITVEIGDAKQADFKPQVKIMRWDNEVNFSLRSKEDVTATTVIDKETIKYVAKDYELHLYDKPEVSEDGGYEIEFVLPSKPKSNIITSTIETKGLNFYKQLALTQEEIDGGANRPDNVINSYAVYHATKGGMNDSAGMEYKIGKAFHIYGIKATDAKGKETWCDQDIDTEKKLHTITIPQKFLDEAVYPVVVDPTFGYTTNGASGSSIAYVNSAGTLIKSYRRGYADNGYTTPSADGTLDSISAYVYSTDNQSIDITAFLNQEDSGGSGSHGLIASSEKTNESVTSTHTKKDFTCGSEAMVSGTTYVLNIIGNGADISGTDKNVYICYDNNNQGPEAYYEDTTSYTTLRDENPWTKTATVSSYNDYYSIYATYTASATGTNCKINIGDTFKDITAIKLNIGDTWKTVTAMKINIGDVWKTVFSLLISLSTIIKTFIHNYD